MLFRSERVAQRVAAAARTMYESGRDKRAEPASVGMSPPSDGDIIDFPELRRAFEALEGRTERMEAFVTSEEMALRRDFRDLGQN